jgi:hypothetical protein
MLVLACLVAGWMAETVSRAGATDSRPLWLVSSAVVIGGTVIWIFVSTGVGMPGMFLIGYAAAAVAIVGQRGLWRSSRLGT